MYYIGQVLLKQLRAHRGCGEHCLRYVTVDMLTSQRALDIDILHVYVCIYYMYMYIICMFILYVLDISKTYIEYIKNVFFSYEQVNYGLRLSRYINHLLIYSLYRSCPMIDVNYLSVFVTKWFECKISYMNREINNLQEKSMQMV